MEKEVHCIVPSNKHLEQQMEDAMISTGKISSLSLQELDLPYIFTEFNGF